MATLTRRLQVLLDEERFERLSDLADRRGTTVAVLVREALDRSYPRDGIAAAEAADRFLARPPRDLGEWQQHKEEIEDSLLRR
ncbi:MAG: hypothetical protein GEU79_09490 [Acidimicrobiia bacterium]|nr:hypothetical protein [Acidimicrobiia bacterium]